MIETIKSVLKEFPQANLESKSCREKIAEEIEKKIKNSGYILESFWGVEILEKLKYGREKDNGN